MEELQENKHVCKFCYKSFPCGRSLGGHMRSHLKKKKMIISSSPADSVVLGDGNKNGSNFVVNSSESGGGVYELRENPKKSWRLSRECGKGFQSDKAMFDHMASHDDGEEVSWASTDNQSDNEALVLGDHTLKKRKRTTRYKSTTSISSSSLVNDSISFEIEQQLEEVALCLMMLSRDVGYWGGLDSVVESSDNSFGFKKVEFDTVELGKDSSEDRIQCPTKTELMRNLVRESDTESLEYNSPTKKLNFEVMDSEVGKSKYQCTTCSKIFHSYQALGGHKSRHKKLGSCFSSKIESSFETKLPHGPTTNEAELIKTVGTKTPVKKERELSRIIVEKKHECPICFKVFSSGQALGGHKRSHMVRSTERQTTMVPQLLPRMHDLLDLNISAPFEEKTKYQTEFNPWRARANFGKHEPPVSMISH